ncbi:hypothetical protein VPHK406_0136 [Vibrio phage K406]
MAYIGYKMYIQLQLNLIKTSYPCFQGSNLKYPTKISFLVIFYGTVPKISTDLISETTP